MVVKKTVLLLFAFFGMLLAGCGGNNTPVGGKVAFEDGSPLKMGIVVFSSTDGKYQVRGSIKEDGTYTMNETYQKQGILPGDYKVIISGARPLRDPLDHKAKDPKPLIDSKFENPATSGLTFKVEKGKSATFDIKVTAPK